MARRQGATVKGVTPVYADKLEIHVNYTGSLKVLGVPPGSAPTSFRPKTTASFQARKNPPCSFYLDLYLHTALVNTLYVLSEGLAIVVEGLEN